MAAFPVIDFVGTFVGKTIGYPLVRSRNWATEIVKYDSSFEQVNALYTFPVREWEIVHRHLSSTQRDKLVELFDAARGMGDSLYLLDPDDYESVYTWTQTQRAIGAVDQTEDYFRITGSLASEFLVGWEFKVTGSTGNDGVYTVEDISQDGTYTYIYTEEQIPHATGDGVILRMYFQLCKTYYSGETYTFVEPKKDIIPGECVVKVATVTKTEGVDYTLTDTEGIIMFVTGSTPTNGQAIEATFDFYYRVRLASDRFRNIRGSYQYYSADNMTLIEKKRRTTEL